MENTDIWFYAPKFIPFADDIFSELMSQESKFFPERTMVLYGRSVSLKRRSSIITDCETSPYKATDVVTFKWSECGSVLKCKQFLKDTLKLDFDYCLCHLYPNEQAGIAWHVDKEAMTTPIVSISLGETRKFCMKDLKTGEQKDFELGHGDLFLMKTGCQQKFKHCVPKETKSKGPRINLTFRRIES